MKALVYQEPGQPAWESVQDPALDALNVVLTAEPVAVEAAEARALVGASA